MSLPINQFKKIEEKLLFYNKPFIDRFLLQQILDAFAPHYQIHTLCTRKLLSPIRRGELYLNHLCPESIKILSTTILSQYIAGKTHMLGGLYLYNQYGYVEQLADRITVYNTNIHGERIIAGRKFIFRKVTPSFFRGYEQVDAQGYGSYRRMTRERALIQLIDDKDGQLEYDDDIYQIIRDDKMLLSTLISLSSTHCSKRVMVLLHNFLRTGGLIL